MLPDSRRPRRLPIVISAIDDDARSRSGRRRASGMTEISWSTADDVDTATVIT